MTAVAETGRWPSFGAAVRRTLNLSFTGGRTDDSLYAADTDRPATALEVRELELSTHRRHTILRIRRPEVGLGFDLRPSAFVHKSLTVANHIIATT